jgi:RNA polymerase sigma-70 factor (ECF subfamily)
MSSWLSGSKGPMSNDVEHEVLLRDLYNQMIRVAYSRVRNKSDADDVVQDAWVKMLTKHDTLREENKLASWAKTITRNEATNTNKGAVRCQPVDWNEERRKEPAARTEAELMLEISELLGSLDVHSRTMILYKFYYGFKDQEIADAMNMPVGTVKAKIHRTRERLKQWVAAANIW